MKKKWALVTGVKGAIGKAISQRLNKEGFSVIGTDFKGESDHSPYYFDIDLEKVADNAHETKMLIEYVFDITGNDDIDIIVNNAAYQYVSEAHPISPQEFMKSYKVNVIAPYILVSNLLDKITSPTGSVVNIGSVHSRLTKKGFIPYATTKAALASLTRGMALDFGNRFRVNCIEPASIMTDMLVQGFHLYPDRLKTLSDYHPQGRIGSVGEIAELVLLLCSDKVSFLHGSCIDISGGISGLLHDPAG